MDKSKRFCLDCKENTTWKRKKKDLHSSCSICKGFNGCRTLDQIKRGFKPKPRKKNIYKKEKWIKPQF